MKKIIIGLIIILILIAVPVVWYLASPLFINNVVNEGFPVNNTINSEGEMMNEFMDDNFGFELRGDFIDADSFHKTSGIAKIIDTGNSQYLRLEDFETTNGPDLKVYLSKDIRAEDYFSLGDLKGNIGGS